MRKLVELDPVTKKLMEVDLKRVKRTALALRNYILSAPVEEEQLLHYRREMLPIVEAVLSGNMEMPYRGYRPYVRENGEGLLPSEFSRLRAEFLVAATGAHLDAPKIIINDGKEYAWMEFED